MKWLHRIGLADQPFMTREETSKYTDPLADGTSSSVQPDYRRAVGNHVSLVPSDASRVVDGGQGNRLEWARPRTGEWTSALIRAGPGQRRSCRRRGAAESPHAVSAVVAVVRKPTEIVSRAIDETGDVQPEWKDASEVRRAPYSIPSESGHRVDDRADGRVLFAIERVAYDAGIWCTLLAAAFIATARTAANAVSRSYGVRESWRREN